MSEKGKTSAEKRTERIAELKAKLQREQARQNSEIRKERNGQLISLGVYMEEAFKKGNDERRKKIIEDVENNLTGRNLERALKAFERLSS